MTISGVKVSISGYFKTWTVDHGLDGGLDYGPNSAGPPHAHVSFSPCTRTVLYVDLTAKLALPYLVNLYPGPLTCSIRECISGRGFVL